MLRRETRKTELLCFGHRSAEGLPSSQGEAFTRCCVTVGRHRELLSLQEKRRRILSPRSHGNRLGQRVKEIQVWGPFTSPRLLLLLGLCLWPLLPPTWLFSLVVLRAFVGLRRRSLPTSTLDLLPPHSLTVVPSLDTHQFSTALGAGKHRRAAGDTWYELPIYLVLRHPCPILTTFLPVANQTLAALITAAWPQLLIKHH